MCFQGGQEIRRKVTGVWEALHISQEPRSHKDAAKQVQSGHCIDREMETEFSVCVISAKTWLQAEVTFIVLFYFILILGTEPRTFLGGRH